MPEYLYQHPIRITSALIRALFNKQFYIVLPKFLKDLARDLTPNRIRRFGQALVLAQEIEPDRQWLYVHFLHTPASVVRYTSYLNKLPWSCSAHAKDIWTSEDWEIREKLVELEWLVTCTKSNTSHLKALSHNPDKVSLLYHGLDLSRFPQTTAFNHTSGADAGNPVQLVSVGRAVSKKGYDVLLKALAKLPNNLHWQFTHIGGGSLLDELKAQARDLKIDDKIKWLGAQNFEQVLTHYQAADIFVLASRIDKDGDRDGLPNVLMEAMTQRLACVASNISGIPELIINRENGILVEPDQAEQLSNALNELAESPEFRKTLGENGYKTVTEKFSLEANIENLIERFK